MLWRNKNKIEFVKEAFTFYVWGSCFVAAIAHGIVQATMLWKLHSFAYYKVQVLDSLPKGLRPKSLKLEHSRCDVLLWLTFSFLAWYIDIFTS